MKCYSEGYTAILFTEELVKTELSRGVRFAERRRALIKSLTVADLGFLNEICEEYIEFEFGPFVEG